jgi:sRNA-binding protein
MSSIESPAAAPDADAPTVAPATVDCAVTPPDLTPAVSPDEAPAQAATEEAAAEVMTEVATEVANEAVADPAAETGAEQVPATAPKVVIPDMSPAACAQQLKSRFPALFGTTPRPVKLRIQADIQARVPGVFTKQVLSAFLRRHTGTTAYLIALTKASQRFDLDGAPAGEVSEEHRAAANEELQRRRGVHDERRAAEEERRALEQQQWHNRAQLLRDFQSTTLTRTNFCALKGVAEDQLDGLLEIARREAAEWAANRPPVQEREQREPRDARGPRRDDTRGNNPRPAGNRPAAGRPPRR